MKRSGSGRGRRVVSLRFATILIASSIFSSCQTVGVLQTGETPSPQSVRSVVVPADADVRTVAPAAAMPVAEIAEIEVDLILHSIAAADPDFAEDVGWWVNEWSSGQAETFTRYVGRMALYGDIVDAELDARGMPSSLRYLPIVESGYFPAAVSPVGATGLWQLMDPTARDLGLTVSAIVDDRRDPIASTFAALDYLEDLHGRFDSWWLALAAYNTGPGRVQRLIERYGSPEWSGDETFLHLRQFLPAETREFVPRFFAAAALASNPGQYGIVALSGEPLAYDEVIVPDATSLGVIARAADVGEESIVVLNPQYLRGFTPVGEARVVRIPAGRRSTFESNYAALPPGERLDFMEHIVEPGETFTHIARRYHVPLAELTGANGGLDPRRLQIGMRVVVPTSRVSG